MAFIYSWIPAYQQIVARLPLYRNNQVALVQVLRDIGVNVNDDEDRPGHFVPLSEIDPFTFLFFLGKHRNDWNKVKVIRQLCQLWNINEVVYDVCGIPSANAQKLWLFTWQHARNNEINGLWDLFDMLIANTITDDAFEEAMRFPAVGRTKLTEAFFIIKPSDYLCINGKVKPYLNSIGINTDFTTYTEFVALLNNIRNLIPEPFWQISYQSHLYTEYRDHVPAFYRIGSKAGVDGVSLLPEMIHNQIASIGWAEIGNLLEMNPCNRIHVKKALQENGYHTVHNSTASRKAGEIIKFKNEIKPGDYVLAADGYQIKAIGKVISHQYIFDENLDFPHGRSVNWLFQNINDLEISEGSQTSVWKFEAPESITAINDFLGGNNNNGNNLVIDEGQQNNNTNNMALNTIIYGPPGTGKTYSTIDKALEILGEDIEGPRDIRKQIFAEYQNEGRIYFTTFHQNMAYEDFIEGIKPISPEEEDDFLKYEVQDGLFMRACVEATYSYLQTENANNNVIINYLDFNSLFDTLFDRISAAGSEQLTTRSEGEVTANITSQGNFGIRHEGGREIPYTVSRERLSVLYERFPNPDEIINITKEFRQAIGGCNSTAYWSVLKAISNLRDENAENEIQPPPVDERNFSYIEKKIIVKKYWKIRDIKPISNINLKPYIFIIDEINRGNVSQIFGELITLIEDDKRIGKSEVLHIDLPYSKHPFAVPPNLYIIGTMNTADRSVEALDTALRRRFVFEPKMPKPEALLSSAGIINLQAFLTSINNRLTILKDSDHTIGHAWLWDVDSFDKLKEVFSNKILPLLQEYFYNDYEKLGLVLGDAFFELPHKRVGGNEFAVFSGSSGLSGQYRNKYIYKIKATEDLEEADFLTLTQPLIENED
jgi:5-methylcytosine-specific restriction protein B